MENEYTFQEMKSGPLIFKAVLLEIHIDTNATSTAISMKLYDLNTYIDTDGHDINKLNVHVK